jgi:myo-inositol-1(or 4)-monophosphatase
MNAGAAPPKAGPPGPGLLAELLAVAEDVARAAGAMIRDQRPADLGVAATKSSPTDVVTVMDRRSEDLLQEALRAARPGDGLLGEEGASRPSSTGITWVVDPIDGTVNYLYDLPAYCVSVAAVLGDPSVPGASQALVGVVYHPSLDQCYTATTGGGAFRDGQRLGVRDVRDLRQALVATGFSYEVDLRAEQAAVTATILPLVRDIRRLGSAALDLCQVAAGQVDGYYEQGLKPWDLAAGELIATEAGAVVTGRGGGPASQDLVVAAAPFLHAELLDLLPPDVRIPT